MDLVSLSDVTISYQNCNGLKCTLDSILCQRLRSDDIEIDLEVIVVDGASTDGTLELLKIYEDKFSKYDIAFKYISERDDGIYNAMNKGIDIANGEWIMFLNSGDNLHADNVIFDFFFYAKQNYLINSDILYGDSNRKYVDYRTGCETGKIVNSLPIKSIIHGLPFSHQSVFTKTYLFKNRYYDENFKISGDYEWFLDAYQKERTFAYVPICVSDFDTNGISQTHMYENYLEADRIRIMHEVAGNKIIRNIKRLIWKGVSKIGFSSQKVESFNHLIRK